MSDSGYQNRTAAELCQIEHICSGCRLRWTGDLNGAELCGDCWRKGQGVILGSEAAPRDCQECFEDGYAEGLRELDTVRAVLNADLKIASERVLTLELENQRLRSASAGPALTAQIAALRAAFTNEVIRAIGALARQQNVCREQAGQVVFVTGMEAAREYLVEQAADALTLVVGEGTGLPSPSVDHLDALIAARDVLAAFTKQVAWLPEQGGYSTRMTDAEMKVAQAIGDLTRIIDSESSALPSPAGPPQEET